jgi:hypothetical protein
MPWNQTQFGQQSAQKSQEGIAAGHDTAATQQAQIGANAAMLPAELKQNRFNSVFPWLQGTLTSGGFGAGGWGSGGGINANTSPGQIGQAPQITAAPVWSQSQIQQQINGQQAQNDAKTGGQIRDINQSAAGRGFGSGGPLSQALGVIAQGQNTATNTQNAQQTQWNAAQGNAQQLLAGQQAQEGQFSDIQNQDIARHQVIAGQQNALIAALGGLMS